MKPLASVRDLSFVAMFAFVLALVGVSNAAEPTKQQLDFFEAKIRPVLVSKCYSCHSARAAANNKLKGGLRLDTRAGVRAGGDSGASITPGKPGESLLVSALQHDALKMPPKGKLPDSIIANFVKWVEMGAPDPRDGAAAAIAQIDIAAGREFWSFKPFAQITPPEVAAAEGILTPIDRFIRARQLAAGVKGNALADPATLIRRAHFDLLGLPPTPAEVDRFVKQCEQGLPEAHARLIDRLLESPRFGERWARHWLDLARFAESNGYAFDKDRPFAYHYRDFVIRALNDDLPYDQFVRLQLAGDLLDAKQRQTSAQAAKAKEALAATGYLMAGPFTTQQTQKERERSRYEQLDDMVNTLGTSLLGLSLGCARCHNHKYDPLPQADYYRLVACLAEVGFADEKVNLSPESFRQLKSEYDKAHAPLVAAREKFEREQLPARLDAWLENRPADAGAPKFDVWRQLGPFASANFDQAFNKALPPEKKVDLAQTFEGGKKKWTEQPSWVDGKVHNTLKGENAANYLFRYVESPSAQKVSLSLGSDDAIKVWVNGKQVLAKKVSRGAAPDQEKLQAALNRGRNELLIKIVNAGGPTGFYFKATGGPPPDVAKLLDSPPDKWNAAQRKKVTVFYRALDKEWVELNSVVEAHQKKEPKPALTSVYSAKVRGSTYGFGEDTYKVYFLRRGNADNKENLASPGFLQVLMTAKEEDSHWLTTVTKEPSGKPARVALADWITDHEKGGGRLLARVIVNRLWHHHIGRGIVSTPSDFGSRGERPTHPELLDWLATELIRNGWRLKPIHKLIMTSAVYMQAGEVTEDRRKADPDNRTFWRRPPRRLEAEVIRDALLSVSGTLDETMYGKGSLNQATPRRSIYLTVKRSQLIPILQLFDAPDTMQGVGHREQSIVAPQALALINSPFVRGLATKFAARVRPDEKTTIDEAIAGAYKIALSRAPHADELATMKAFIDRQGKLRGATSGAEALAVRDFCHLLLCSNEFVFVD